MINKDYWVNFYKQNPNFEQEPSSFAKWVAEVDKHFFSNRKKRTLLDLGAGNCRDSLFFHKCGYTVTAVDDGAPPSTDFPFTFFHLDFLDFEIKEHDVIYLRFVLHALTEKDLDLLIQKLTNTSFDFIIYIETRSTRGITNLDKAETYFKSSVGDKHFRMLYSRLYLNEKFSKHFNILSEEESNEFAQYKGDKPYVLRYILKNK